MPAALADVLGFKHDDRVRLKQVDWTSVIGDAARFIATRVRGKVEAAGGGTLDPPIDFPKEDA